MDLSSTELGPVLGCYENRREPSGSYKAGNLLAAGTAIKIVLLNSALVCLSVCLSVCVSTTVMMNRWPLDCCCCTVLVISL